MKNLSQHPWLILVISLSAAVIAFFIVTYFVRKLLRRSDRELINTLIKGFKFPALFFFLVIGINIALPFFEAESGFSGLLRKLNSILNILSVAWLAIAGVNVLRAYQLRKYRDNAKTDLHARAIYTRFKVLEQIAVGFIICVAIFAVLMTFDRFRQLGMSLLASAGIAGIIVGLAAQKSIGTILAGIQIAMTQPIRIDDFINIEGEAGTVEEINLTYVVVRTWDERRLIVPINNFIETPFQNWTITSTQLIGSVFLYADYSIPVEELRKEFDRLIQNHEKWDGRVKALQVTDVTSSSVQIRILVSAKDSGTTFELRADIREKMIAFMQKNYPASLPRMRLLQNGNEA